MFTTLIASRPHRAMHLGDVSVSAVVHSALLALAVWASAQAGPLDEEARPERLIFAQPEAVKDEPPPEPEPEPVEQPRDVLVGDAPAKGFQVLTAPVTVPDVLPAIDLTKAVTNEADFSGRGVEGGIARGVVGGKPVTTVPADQPYFEFQVEKPVVPVPGSAVPRYPEILRSGGVEGTVLAQFVVDTLGRVEPGSFRALQSPHELFTSAVRATTPGMRFLPAEVGGRRVKQLVQQPFEFLIQR